MMHRTKNPGTCSSARIANVAYKPSWSEKVELNRAVSENGVTETLKASAAEDVNDLRPLRGALRASLTSSSLRLNPNYGELTPPLFLKKGDDQKMNPALPKTLFLFDRSHPLRK